MLKLRPVREILSEAKRRQEERTERTRLRNAENLRQERQRNDVLLKPDGDADVTNKEVQAGRRLHRSEIVKRIGRLTDAVWYEQSIRYPAQGGLYANDFRSPYGKRLVASLPHEMVNEFDRPLTVPSVIPDPTIAMHWQVIQRVESKEPGWRAVLLKLAMDGFITASGIEAEFHITRGRSSQHWQKAMN